MRVVNIQHDPFVLLLAAVRRSQPQDYDGHTEFGRLSPDARLTWLEAAVRFIQSSKTVRRPPSSPEKSA